MLDRYFLHQIAGRFGAVLVTVMALMTVEHLPRLFDAVQLTGAKGYIVLWSIIGLLPEYLGIGLLFGLYLSVGLTLRTMALRSEVDAIRAAGVSTFRMLRVPFLAALATAFILMGNQGWLRPMGEDFVRKLGIDMRTGVYGLMLQSKTPIALDDKSTLMFDTVDRKSGHAQGVFLARADSTISARSGQMSQTADGRLSVKLSNGMVLDNDSKGDPQFGQFKQMNVVLDVDGVEAVPVVAEASGVDAITLGQLVRSKNPAALAAMVSRMLWAWFALLVPIFALTLSVPPRRSTAAVGLFVGGILIVLFIRSAAALQASGTTHPLLAGFMLALGWAGAAVLMLIGRGRSGDGFVDNGVLALAKWLLPMLSRHRLPTPKPD